MKREFLKTLELSDEAIEKIMSENGKDVEAEKEKAQTKETELSTANGTIKSLQDAVKKFDGVDIEKLKGDVKTWETKYNNDISELKLHSALNTAIVAAGAKNAKLVKAALDMSKIKLDGESPIGLSEQLEALKKSDSYLFADTAANASGSTGMAQGGGGTPDMSKLSDEEYYAKVFETKK